MTTKILIDCIEGGKPAIRVKMKDNSMRFEQELESDDLRDKMCRLFFEDLGHESPFVGVVRGDSNPNNDLYLIPLKVPHAMEWMQKVFLERLPGKETIVIDIFNKINDLYCSCDSDKKVVY